MSADDHRCEVCGADNAPFGYDYPHALKWYCREHWPDRPKPAGDADEEREKLRLLDEQRAQRQPARRA